jgi:rSAM/selenodomain-associated transferase 1
MKKICYIAARAPHPGQVKTRLGAEIGYEAAAALYTGFLQDLEAKLSRASFPVCWYVTPGHWVDRPHREQGEGDWTDRQARLFRDAAGRGEERVVLIASDSPQIEVAVIHEAFAELAHKQLVLGPVEDGGYYLIGMRGWHDVFSGVEMTSRTTMDAILVRARALGLTTGFTDPMFDVDELADLNRLIPMARSRSDLAHTRRALAQLRIGAAA